MTLSSEAHSILLSGQLLQDIGKVVRPVGSMIVGPLLNFSDCEVSSWLEAILCRIPWWWIRHSVSTWVVVLMEALPAGPE